jgi:hypothetical protein
MDKSPEVSFKTLHPIPSPPHLLLVKVSADGVLAFDRRGRQGELLAGLLALGFRLEQVASAA